MVNNIDDKIIYAKDLRPSTAKKIDSIVDIISEIAKAEYERGKADTIDDAPSIDIVRCQDCKYWNTSGCRDGVGGCEWAYYMTKPDDFCSYGEREGE